MGVNQTVGFPTQQAFVGDLIPRRQLQEAVGMYSLVFNTCRAIGPALAGYIIAEWGAGTAFGGNVDVYKRQAFVGPDLMSSWRAGVPCVSTRTLGEISCQGVSG